MNLNSHGNRGRLLLLLISALALAVAGHNLLCDKRDHEHPKPEIWAKLAQELKSNVSLDGPVSGLISRSSTKGTKADLRTNANLLSKWLERSTKNEADYEIPSFPLDQQPDPERVTHIDTDLRFCTGAIKDQGSCGACYAFSWNSLVEWHYCKQTNGESQLDLSEQFIVDCGHAAHLKGCKEGKLSDVRDFTHTFGFYLEKDYPYVGTRNACKHKKKTASLLKIKDFTRVRIDREHFERLLTEQPILLEVHLPEDILDYSSGIHPGHNCDKNRGHGMLLVGHGSQDGRPYWLLRNSMGKKWGENGYFRLARDMPDMSRCFKSAFVAKFKFGDLDENMFVDFYDSLEVEPEVERMSKAEPKVVSP